MLAVMSNYSKLNEKNTSMLLMFDAYRYCKPTIFLDKVFFKEKGYESQVTSLCMQAVSLTKTNVSKSQANTSLSKTTLACQRLAYPRLTLACPRLTLA